MKKRLKKLFIFLLLGLMILYATAFPVFGLTAEATVDSDRISAGESVRLSINISGGNPSGPPSIKSPKGLQIQYNGQASSIQIINGRYSSSIIYNYTVLALQAGEYTLGPFEIIAGGKKTTTNSIKLYVSGGAGANSQSQGDNGPSGDSQRGNHLYLTMELPRTRLYVGETVPAKIRLFIGNIAVEDIHYPVIEQPDFIVSEMSKPTERRTIINGIQYQVLEFSTSLGAVKSGDFTLGPAVLQCNIVSRNSRDPFFGGFFDNYEKRPWRLTSQPIKIKVLPLPDAGRPRDFSGAIGQFQTAVNVSPTDVLQGDPVTVQITVSGRGNMSAIAPPSPGNTGGFKVYDPQKKQTASGDGASREEQVVYEQVLIPLEPGALLVGPYVFSYFDPEEGRYKTATAAAVPINVKANPNFNASYISEAPGSKPEELGRDLIYIKDTPGRLTRRGNELYRQTWFWILLAAPVLLLPASLYYRKVKLFRESDSPKARASRAYTLAVRQLDKIKKELSHHEPDKSLDQLHRVIREYFALRYNLPAAGMTGSIVTRLAPEGIDPPVLQEIRDFFSQYDLFRFTGGKPSHQDISRFLDMACDIVSHLNSKEPSRTAGSNPTGKEKGA